MKSSFSLTLTLGLLTAACAVRAESVTYQYVTIDAPGAFGSTASGINNMGEIVGSGDTHGFLDNHGVFTTIDAPGSVTTLPYGINDRAQIAVAAGGPYASYVYSGGTFTPVQVAGAQLVQDSVSTMPVRLSDITT